jgi:hypothetical protein
MRDYSQPGQGGSTREAAGGALIRARGDRTVVAALRLALGRPIETFDGLDWVELLSVALTERLAALSWHRSGPTIRRAAPPDAAARWRTAAVAIQREGQHRLQLLADIQRALHAADVPMVVLKGMPLSSRLYGDPFVRPSDDIDLFVPAKHRDAARRALEGDGWRSVAGRGPWDELFGRDDGKRAHLEVHSDMASEYLGHLRLPAPTARPYAVEGIEVQAYMGDSEPGYLSAHLAGHHFPPLLWAIDIHTLWEGLTTSEREAARRAANFTGMGRYLTWGLAMADAIDRAADGDAGAPAVLTAIGAQRARPQMSIVRHARLAANPLDAMRAVSACIWPPSSRSGMSSLAESLVRRVRLRGGYRTAATRRTSARPGSLDSP